MSDYFFESRLNQLLQNSIQGNLQRVKSCFQKNLVNELSSSFDNNGLSALHVASLGGHLDIVQYLHRNGANLNLLIRSRTGHPQNAIWAAVSNVKFSVAMFLLFKGAEFHTSL